MVPFVMQRQDAQAARGAFGLQVDAGHQAVPGQDGQAEVAEDPPGRRLEDLQRLIESEQAGRADAVPEHRIEGRQQHAAVLPGSNTFEPVGQVEVRGPDPAGGRPAAGILAGILQGTRHDRTLLLERGQRGPDPGRPVPQAPGGGQGSGGRPAVAFEGAQQQHLQALGLGQGPRPHACGNHPLDEVVRALEVAPFEDGQRPAGPQRRGHLLHGLQVPPPSPARALHVHRAQGALPGDALEQAFGHLRMRPQQIAPPGMDAELLPPELERGIEVEGQPAGLVAPVLEHGLAGLEQRLAQGGVHPLQAGHQHQGVAAGPGHRDGVQLQVAEPVEDLQGGGPCPLAAARGAGGQVGPFGLEKAGSGQGQAARGAGGDGFRGGRQRCDPRLGVDGFGEAGTIPRSGNGVTAGGSPGPRMPPWGASRGTRTICWLKLANTLFVG